jgi:predicted Holliday junction resolvase-like endonuclease
MSILRTIRADPDFWGVCPCCSDQFMLPEAQLFELTAELPEIALAKIVELKAALKQQRQELARTKHLMTERAAATAQAVHVGKICEKIVPSFPSFPFAAQDCRSLLEPIDFVSFSGLSATGKVHAIEFVEVKTGKATLSSMQKAIAAASRDAKVEFDVIPAGRG